MCEDTMWTPPRCIVNRVRSSRILWTLALLLTITEVLAIDEPCDDGSGDCKNGATCIKVNTEGQTKNMCICTEQYTGWDCSVKIDYCKNHCKPYRKDISCQQALCNQGTLACNCGPFFSGYNCEIEYNPCSQPATNPCGHGTCVFIRGTNQVICQCHPGWMANLNQQVMKLTWNGADIFVSPPCTGMINLYSVNIYAEPIKRGITGLAPMLTPSELNITYASNIQKPKHSGIRFL
uniref:Membrane protein, putative n=1 Tax=Babesia bovis TaxID=5865 RepID=A7ASG4_BABBO|eukprot:XP_001611051.1 hypothetical protein [Babesia bovis T2Bo]